MQGRGIWVKTAISLLVIGIMLGFAYYPLPVLRLGAAGQSPALLVPLVYGPELTLEYHHSVQKTPVREHLVLAPGNQLKLTSTTYHSLGAGLPFLPSEGRLVNEEGTFKLTGLNRVFREIRLAVMPVTYQGIVYHDRHYVLADYFAPGSLVEMRVQSYSPGQLVWLKIQARKGGTP